MEKIIIKCRNSKCRQKLAVPNLRRSLKITCPKCKFSFTYRFNNYRFVLENSWKLIKRSINEHRFISGFIAIFWITTVFRLVLRNEPILIIKATLILLFIWLLLCWIAESIAKERFIKWYHRSSFVILVSFLFAPVGVPLLISSPSFRKNTKIILTIIFIILFLSGIYTEEKYKILSNQGRSVLDDTYDLITSSKKKIFISQSSLKPENINLCILDKKSSIELTIDEIARNNVANTVTIITKDKNGREIGSGSGFVINKDGFVATNYHVVEGAYFAELIIGNKTYKSIFLIDANQKYDIALLKIADPLTNFYGVFIGDSDRVITGEEIVAMGSPLGLENTVSSGIISAIRDIKNIKLFQITAPISPGSSGGPIFNRKGEVIGITTIASFWLAQNVNFAIPINYFKEIIKK